MKTHLFSAALLYCLVTFAHAEDQINLDEIVVTATRFKDTYADKPVNVTIISNEDIKKSSARTVPELLSEQSGISVRDLFGNNATGATVDLRGFGAAAGQNTLILLDGRRITDPDSSGVQWSSIPFSSIERIEIVRGSGAVLYGDGATNGVINIITRVADKVGKDGQVSAKSGSYGMNELQANANYFSGKSGFDFTASKLISDGYRANNRDEQANAQGNIRGILASGELSMRAGIDRQITRLPGARTVQPGAGINQVESDPRGTSTPLDYASRDGDMAGIDLKQRFSDIEMDIDLAHRTKKQKSYFDFSGYPNYRDSGLQVTSLTPNFRMPNLFGSASTVVAGVDLHYWEYGLRTSNAEANIDQPINTVSMSQQNKALYLQDTTPITAATTLMAGVRNEWISMNATDIYNAGAPGASSGSGAAPGVFEDAKNSYELGLRHQINSEYAASGRIGHSFRFANVDEIYEQTPAYTRQFQFLRPQTADSVELGFEQKTMARNWRITIFDNKIQDEIHLDAFTSGIGNTNLPPSERKGLELDGKWHVAQQLALSAAYTYTDAKFLSGVLPGGAFTQLNVDIAGKYVPLVPMHKANLGVSWSMTAQTQLNVSVAYVDSQFMDNDEANTLGIKIPAYSIADLKIVHRTGAWQLNATVNNLFDTSYYNYAVSSQFTAGKFNAYTLPGRTIFFGASYQM